MKNPTLICLTYLLISLACCRDKEVPPEQPPAPTPTLPPITSEGRNTFGCLVNGKVFLPNEYKDDKNCEYSPIGAGQSFDGLLTIGASKHKFTNDKHTGIRIQLYNRVFNTGKYLLYSDHQIKNILLMTEDIKEYDNFSTTDTNNFILLSRLDISKKIVSGTFQYNVINRQDITDTLKITEGRFDFKF